MVLTPITDTIVNNVLADPIRKLSTKEILKIEIFGSSTSATLTFSNEDALNFKKSIQ